MSGENYLPAEWNDEERITSLFKPLPSIEQRVARTARLNFWTAALHRWSAVTNQLVFNSLDAKQAFQKGTQSPQCLPDVLAHLLQEGSLCRLSSITDDVSTPPVTWGRWGMRLLTAPPKWAWGKLVGGTQEKVGEREPLVDVSLLQKRSNELYNEFWKERRSLCEENARNISTDPERVRKLPQFLAEAGGLVDCSVSDLQLCLTWLAKQGLAATLHKDDASYVKLARPGCTHTPISLSETVEVDLEEARAKLQERVDQLTQESEALQTEAKNALKIGRKEKALSLLRRRRRCDASLKAQLGALENCSSCILQLSDARINREVVSTFKSTALALKELVSGDQSPEEVEKTMDDLQQVLDECSDVGEALSSSLRPEEEASSDVLERELQELLAGGQEEGGCVDDIVSALANVHIPVSEPHISPHRTELTLDESVAPSLA